MAIDNFCEGKSMVTTDYEILKKAAAELNEIMHAAHINASDRTIYVSGMLLSMYDEYLSPDSFPEYNLKSRDSRFIYNHLLTFLGTVLSGEKYEMVSREFEVLVKAYNEKKEYPGIPVILDRISDSGCDWNYENHSQLLGY